MKHIALLLLSFLTLAAPAGATDMTALRAAKATLATAHDGGDPAAYRRARAAFAALAAAEPRDAKLQYWAAFAAWRAVPMVSSSDPEVAKKLCRAGLSAAERAIALDPGFADAIAIHASLQGLSIAFLGSADRATLGMQMVESLAQAVTMEPQNPRVVFLQALNTLHMPEFVGGGPARARPLFERAGTLFDEAAPATSPSAPDWGHDDVYAWSGQCALALGDTAGAISAYHKALEINPGYGWVRSRLLPATQPKADADKP